MCNCKSLLHIHSFNQGGGCAAAGQSPVCQIHIWQCKCKSPLHTHQPFNQGGRCAAAGKLLAKEPELKANFSRAQGAGSNAKANKVARFLPNPEANWGPKPKHGRAVKVCDLCTLCMFQSNFLHSHQTPASLSPYISGCFDCCPVIFKPLGFSALPFPPPFSTLQATVRCYSKSLLTNQAQLVQACMTVVLSEQQNAHLCITSPCTELMKSRKHMAVSVAFATFASTCSGGCTCPLLLPVTLQHVHCCGGA